VGWVAYRQRAGWTVGREKSARSGKDVRNESLALKEMGLERIAADMPELAVLSPGLATGRSVKPTSCSTLLIESNASRLLSLREERVQEVFIRLGERNNLDRVTFSFQVANRVI